MKYIVFNKPFGVLSQFTSDVHKTLADFNLPKNVYAVGRLDKDSEGLLLLSDDGPFIKEFLDKHERKYWAQVEKIPEPKDIKKLSLGVMIKSGLTSPCKVSLIEAPNLPKRIPPIRERKNIPTAWLELALLEGKNRQVRKMTAAIGHPTLRLFRCSLGKIHFDNLNLTSGSWIEVSKKDII